MFSCRQETRNNARCPLYGMSVKPSGLYNIIPPISLPLCIALFSWEHSKIQRAVIRLYQSSSRHGEVIIATFDFASAQYQTREVSLSSKFAIDLYITDVPTCQVETLETALPGYGTVPQRPSR